MYKVYSYRKRRPLPWSWQSF